jgi:hypothetical protein
MREPAPRPQPRLGERAEPPPRRATVAENLAFEESHPGTDEYVDGYVDAVAPLTPRHQLLAGNIFGHLWTAARGTGCRAYLEVGLAVGVDVFRAIPVPCPARAPLTLDQSYEGLDASHTPRARGREPRRSVRPRYAPA